uniref:Reverse transcriptase domain-containing protein n=1 Tax=Tanacetum cinerariifolium TaxID=118510 RepID=A0A699HCG1_TANCI|nr:reverse transcriptase domain-containing protein [Tanacetum cinerariifolium]
MADTKSTKTELSCEWKLITDEAASFDGFGAGLMLIDPEGKEYTYTLSFRFRTTNNEPEYKVLLVGLRISQEMEITSLAIFIDLQLLGFDSYTIEHIQRNQNKKADALSKLDSMTFEHLTKEMLVEVQPKRSIEEKEIIQTDDIVKEVHKGSCGFNAEPRSMVVRIMKQGYYWPSMHRDAAKEYMVCKFGVTRIISLKDEKHFREGIFVDLYKGLKVTQSFFPITEHMEIMNHIEKQLARSQQGWLDDLAQAIIHIPENDVAKDDRGRIKEVDKRRGNKEISSIEEAYYRSKLCRLHSERSRHFIYKIGDFILLSQSNTGGTQETMLPMEAYRQAWDTIFS